MDAARRYPTVVCQVHQGIVDGVLERHGALGEPAAELIPIAEPGAYRLLLPDPVVPEPNRS